MNYKNYQQVLSLTTKLPKVVKKQRSVRKCPTVTGKKRTKTGCLTCRKRKKKCDEDKVDGKCQACTRNFLPCCWPTSEAMPAQIKKTEEIVLTPISSPAFPAIAYPSPKSPIDLDHDDDVKSLSLDNSDNYKLVKADDKSRDSSETIRKDEPQFIITSVDNHHELCQIPSN